MSEAEHTPDPPKPVRLVPGRECGECSVCCVVLTIDDPELQKAQGYRCRHLLPGRGCGIYETRPRTCRDFYCGWRQLKWVKSGLRPDRSGVLVREYNDVPRDGSPPRPGIIVALLTNAALKAEGLAETVAAAVAGGVAVFLHVPGPPGYTSARVRLTEALTGPVERRDKKAVLDLLRRARNQGRSGDFEPIRFKPREGRVG